MMTVEEKQACLSMKVSLLWTRVDGRVATTATTKTTTTKNRRKDELETAIQCGVEQLFPGGGGRMGKKGGVFWNWVIAKGREGKTFEDLRRAKRYRRSQVDGVWSG